MENNNQKLQFKTNINCGGCIAAVKPHLDSAEGIGKWEVDTTGKDKILTVEPAGISGEGVIEAVQKAGYKIEAISRSI